MVEWLRSFSGRTCPYRAAVAFIPAASVQR